MHTDDAQCAINTKICLHSFTYTHKNAFRFEQTSIHIQSATLRHHLATHHVEVQSVDADAGVVLDAQIDVLLDTEAEVSSIGEVVLSQLVLTHLEAAEREASLATQQE